MTKYSLLAGLILLSGCATAELSVSDLPRPVFVNGSDGTTHMPPSEDVRPSNALDYDQIDTMIKSDKYSEDRGLSHKSLNYNPSLNIPYVKRASNNIIFYPNGFSSSNAAYELTYRGDRFVPNKYGFAEQTTGEITKIPYEFGDFQWDGLARTKLVLGGGTTGLNYVDFGYWIGVPKNTTKKPAVTAFANATDKYYASADKAQANTSYTGRAAAVAVDPNVKGSARELGGTATLTLDNNKRSHLNLAFQDYYTFDFYGNHYGDIDSVTVTGTNSNGGPAFSSCLGGDCNASASYSYVGQYRGDEVGGTYQYTDGDSNLVGAFGAKLD